MLLQLQLDIESISLCGRVRVPTGGISPQAERLIWCDSRADSESLDGRRFVFDILFFRDISRRFINVRSFCISQKVFIYKNILI